VEARLEVTNLYNQRPTWLDLAHKRLDAGVFAACGWPDENLLKTRTGTATNSGSGRATVQGVAEPVPVFISTAYGWDPGMSDEELLERLLQLKLERA
jgi:hypothetical protein